MMFTCMFLGQYKGALEAANTIRRILPREILAIQGRPKIAYMTEAYYAMKMHVLVRFGQWQAIIDEPMPDDPELYLVSTTMQHYARGVAFATIKNIAAAEAEQARFFESLRRIPADRRFLSNHAHAILGVGEKMLEGELEYHKGHHEAAFAALREAVRRDDSLGYTEPWAWMHPPRHALAALLAEQGHYAEAEEVYRDDLGLSGRIQRCTQHPDNVWALHGIVECLRRRGEQAEYARLSRKLDDALAKADVPITSSCMCRGTVHAQIDSGLDCCS
jgi:tetratricopeptide (TPR) repeat protein